MATYEYTTVPMTVTNDSIRTEYGYTMYAIWRATNSYIGKEVKSNKDGHKKFFRLAKHPVGLFDQQLEEDTTNHNFVAASMHHLEFLRQLRDKPI